MAKKQPLKFKLRIDIQCSVCGSLSHYDGGDFPKFCPCCGGAMERFCLGCQKKADMFFEEWWPDDEECIRTYSPAKRCPRCNSILQSEGRSQEDGREYPN
jgi:hypothetical protein